MKKLVFLIAVPIVLFAKSQESGRQISTDLNSNLSRLKMLQLLNQIL